MNSIKESDVCVVVTHTKLLAGKMPKPTTEFQIR